MLIQLCIFFLDICVVSSFLWLGVLMLQKQGYVVGGLVMWKCIFVVFVLRIMFLILCEVVLCIMELLISIMCLLVISVWFILSFSCMFMLWICLVGLMKVWFIYWLWMMFMLKGMLFLCVQLMVVGVFELGIGQIRFVLIGVLWVSFMLIWWWVLQIECLLMIELGCEKYICLKMQNWLVEGLKGCEFLILFCEMMIILFGLIFCMNLVLMMFSVQVFEVSVKLLLLIWFSISGCMLRGLCMLSSLVWVMVMMLNVFLMWCSVFFICLGMLCWIDCVIR